MLSIQICPVAFRIGTFSCHHICVSTARLLQSATKAHEEVEEIATLMAQVHMIVLVGEPTEGEVPKLALGNSIEVSYEEVLLSARGAKPAN